MEKRIKSRYNQAILNEAMRRFNISEEKIQELDGFESFIYEFERPDGEYILRIGHSLRRSEALIQGEVDWINYLAAGGASVSKAIQSKNGKLVEHHHVTAAKRLLKLSDMITQLEINND